MIDDSNTNRSSLQQVRDCPVFRADKTRFVLGPTQSTLPSFPFDDTFEIALLDGPHAYPFPELEYYFIYPRLNVGGLLILDDIHIPTIGHMFTVLREDRMFELVTVIRTTAILKRTTTPVFDPLADGWWTQEYNVKRFKQPNAAMLSLLRRLGLYRPARSLYRRLKSAVHYR